MTFGSTSFTERLGGPPPKPRARTPGCVSGALPLRQHPLPPKPGQMPPEVLRSFAPRLRDLVGLTGENAVEHPWYTGPVYTMPYLGGPGGDGLELHKKENVRLN